MDQLLRLLPGIVRAAGDADEVAEAAALVAWRHAAGDQLRQQAIPFRLYRRTLIVAVADRVWQKQLEAVSGQLLFRVNSMLGQTLVTYIEFRIDPETVNRRRAETQTLNLLERAEIEERALQCAGEQLNSAATATIRDESLRNRFLLAAGSCIARRERESK